MKAQIEVNILAQHKSAVVNVRGVKYRVQSLRGTADAELQLLSFVPN